MGPEDAHRERGASPRGARARRQARGRAGASPLRAPTRQRDRVGGPGRPPAGGPQAGSASRRPHREAGRDRGRASRDGPRMPRALRAGRGNPVGSKASAAGAGGAGEPERSRGALMPVAINRRLVVARYRGKEGTGALIAAKECTGALLVDAPAHQIGRGGARRQPRARGADGGGARGGGVTGSLRKDPRRSEGVMEHATIRPYRFTERQLAKVGVEMADPSGVLLQCMKCGRRWSPNLPRGGRRRDGYWKCPDGCNVHSG